MKPDGSNDLSLVKRRRATNCELEAKNNKRKTTVRQKGATMEGLKLPRTPSMEALERGIQFAVADKEEAVNMKLFSFLVGESKREISETLRATKLSLSTVQPAYNNGLFRGRLLQP